MTILAKRTCKGVLVSKKLSGSLMENACRYSYITQHNKTVQTEMQCYCHKIFRLIFSFSRVFIYILDLKISYF